MADRKYKFEKFLQHRFDYTNWITHMTDIKGIKGILSDGVIKPGFAKRPINGSLQNTIKGGGAGSRCGDNVSKTRHVDS